MQISPMYFKKIISVTFTLLVTFSLITALHSSTATFGNEGYFEARSSTISDTKLAPVSMKIAILVINGSISFYIKIFENNSTIFKIQNITHGIWYYNLPYRTRYLFIITSESGNPYYSITITLFGLENDFVLLDFGLLFTNIILITIYLFIIRIKRNKTEDSKLQKYY